jgi:hypothetical protein
MPLYYPRFWENVQKEHQKLFLQNPVLTHSTLKGYLLLQHAPHIHAHGALPPGVYEIDIYGSVRLQLIKLSFPYSSPKKN